MISTFPLLDGDHVTDDAGTGFVHTAPATAARTSTSGSANGRLLDERDIDTRIPYTVDENGAFTGEPPASRASASSPTRARRATPTRPSSRRLIEAGALLARGKLKHQYPHSWRSKKPVIFRNTPQWFIAMDKPIGAAADLARDGAQSDRRNPLGAIDRREPHRGMVPPSRTG